MDRVGRMRFLVALCLLALVVLVYPASAHHAEQIYCHPEGDFCYEVERVDGRRVLSLSSSVFQGRYKVCVTAPDGSRRCRTSRLERVESSEIYTDSIVWPAEAPGAYSARWKKAGDNLGPRLGWHIRG